MLQLKRQRSRVWDGESPTTASGSFAEKVIFVLAIYFCCCFYIVLTVEGPGGCHPKKVTPSVTRPRWTPFSTPLDYMMYHYFVPAFLYCLYNNLAFVNLSVFDPTSYYLLLQFRVVVTGVLFQMLFKKQLSTKQWLSLVLLTAGCIIKQLPFSSSSPTTDPPVQQVTDPDVVITSMDKHMTSVFSWNMLLILIQIVCSCLAGVYNELLLKSTDSEACNIYIQNTFMYVDSIVCNVALLGWQGQLSVVWDTTQLDHLLDFKVILVILNNAAIGVVTSFFLRSLNSILKTFASALELIFTALLTWLFFSIPIHLNTFFAIFVVSIAVIMYSQNPVINVRIPKETTFKEVSSV
ncbi:hypothetical protein J6590_020149 [Homalodisca vitripennis]|nr:hypothetical protein J6590_020149 [Homalodisca vitripennis]